MSRIGWALLALALASAARAQNTSLGGDDAIVVTGRRPSDPCGIVRQVFVSPVGQPFRALPGEAEPVAAWFRHADLDDDGALTAAEFGEDAATWFERVDRDHDGEIVPDEMIVYERDTVPEVSTYERTAADRAAAAAARRAAKPDAYGAPVGAARFGLTRVPHPLASADQDYDRGIDLAELEAVAAKAFAELAKGKPRIVLADLPKTPQQAHIRRCRGEAVTPQRSDRPGSRPPRARERRR